MKKYQNYELEYVNDYTCLKESLRIISQYSKNSPIALKWDAI